MSVRHSTFTLERTYDASPARVFAAFADADKDEPLGKPPMRGRAAGGTMTSMIETPTSVTVIHGAMLSFETVEARDADAAPLRVREQHATLLRVIDGVITLEVDGAARTLMLEGEARIEPGVPHRIWNAGPGDSRIVQEFRRAG